MNSPKAQTDEHRDAARYHAWYAAGRGAWMGAVEAASLIRIGGIGPGVLLLDAGCGTGWFSRRFAEHGATVIAADRDGARLAYARDAGPSARPPQFVQADMRRLPFADRSVDVVTAVTSLCFVADQAGALRELLRVARRRVLLGLLHRGSLLYLAKRRALSYAGAHWHTRAEVEALLARLPDVGGVSMESHLFWPGGAGLGRAFERLPGLHRRWGAFLAVAIDVAARPTRVR